MKALILVLTAALAAVQVVAQDTQWTTPFGGEVTVGDTIEVKGAGSASGGAVAILCRDLGNNCVIEGEVYAAGYAGFALSFDQQKGSFLSAYSGNGGLEVWKHEGNGRTSLSAPSVPWPRNDWQQFRLVRQANGWTISIGNNQGSVVIPTEITGQRFGLIGFFGTPAKLRTLKIGIAGSLPPLASSSAATPPGQAPAVPSPTVPNPLPAQTPGSAVASSVVPSPAPREQPVRPRRMAASTTSSAGTVNLQKLKPEDWVRGLPDQAQAKYFEIRVSLRGNERIEALRSWVSQWASSLRDPNRAFVEFDYIRSAIENREPLLCEKTNVSSRSDRVHQEAAMRLRLSVLDSLDNIVRSIRTRGLKDYEILKMIGEWTDAIAKERSDLVEKLSGRR